VNLTHGVEVGTYIGCHVKVVEYADVFRLLAFEGDQSFLF